MDSFQASRGHSGPFRTFIVLERLLRVRSKLNSLVGCCAAILTLSLKPRRHMFNRASAMNTDLSRWDVSKVTDMQLGAKRLHGAHRTRSLELGVTPVETSSETCDLVMLLRPYRYSKIKRQAKYCRGLHGRLVGARRCPYKVSGSPWSSLGIPHKMP
jgi:surface protein